MRENKFKALLLEILRGTEGSVYGELSLRRALRAEDGMLTWATLLAVVLFCTLIAMVFNVGRIVNDKIEAQNAADSVAYSASLVQARSMNAITAANHMMGELTALYVMHHAIGGKVLDDGGDKANLVTIGLNLAVDVAFVAAEASAVLSLPESLANPVVFPGDVGLDIPKGEATVYDAKCLLKAKMIIEYGKYGVGSAQILKGHAQALSIILSPLAPGTIASGVRKQASARKAMNDIKREYEIINKLERFAIKTRFVKKTIIPAILKGLWNYEKYIAGDLIPRMGSAKESLDAGKFVATKNIAVGEVLGRPTLVNVGLSKAGISTAVLAIKQDPTRPTSSDNPPEHTQLIRATYPWVQEWRWPILVAMDVPFIGVPRSRASRFYEYHSDRYTKEVCEQFRTEKKYRLYVMEEVDATKSRNRDKGTETWRTAEQSLKADQMFALVGLARKLKSPSMSHVAFLPITNTEPVMAMSQAIIYNANQPIPWEPKNLADRALAWTLGREAQPVPAWDTLNWTEGATEWKNGKKYFDIFSMIAGWFPSGLPSNLLNGFAKDLQWVLGFATPMDIPFPPDIPLPLIGGTPTPKVALNWQAKLVPISMKNLLPTISPASPGRAAMVRDEQMKKRMVNQVVPASLLERTGLEYIHH